MQRTTNDRRWTVIGLDIGGANLKAAHIDGVAQSNRFALWKQPDQLSEALRQLVESMPTFDAMAVTMTGELCDCFATSADGVLHILDAVQALARAVPVRVWRTDGTFVDIATARAMPRLCAAANWLALAAFAARFAPQGLALVFDIGSTTSDLVPLFDGRPIPRARTDPERLESGELVYTGVRRTPLCALLGAAGAAEFFATTHDVYLVLSWCAEDANDCDTADGRPATRACSHNRLARMLCGDSQTISLVTTEALAARIHEIQRGLLEQAFVRVTKDLGPPCTVILSGTGEFLGRHVVGKFSIQETVSLQQQLGPELSVAACAWAVATLAAESDVFSGM